MKNITTSYMPASRNTTPMYTKEWEGIYVQAVIHGGFR